MAEGTNLGSAYGEIKIGTEEATGNLKQLSGTLTSLGAGLSGAITTPILGIGYAAIDAGTKLNEGLANVASLGLTTDRVLELKGEIQDMAVETGKSTSDMTSGLYQVESAFGDSADTAAILAINAKSAAAGLATTTDAINLTSAVTKGFGDTTKEAVQHTSDLALKTVELGQTTFPQLAGAIGTVVPVATQLSVTQEELFAVMATGSGVTGTTGQVSTQLRGILQSLMVPTASMTDLFKQMGVANGEALVKQEGLQGAIQAVVAAAEKSGEPLQGYIGSIEGQTLALTLAGPQAEKYASNLAGMADAAGKTESAFLAQTQGVNAAGFAMQQARIKLEVFFQKIYDGLGPAMGAVATLIEPLADKLLALADWFAAADSKTQLFIVAIGGIAVAIGPAMIAIGLMLPALEGIGAALALISGPIGLVILGVALLGVAWATNFGGIRDKTYEVINSIRPYFEQLVAFLRVTIPQALLLLQNLWTAGWTRLQVAVSNVWAAIQPTFQNISEGIRTALPGALTTLQALWTAGWNRLTSSIGVFRSSFSTAVTPIIANITTALPGALTTLQGLWTTGWNAMGGIIRTAWTGMLAALNTMRAWLTANLPAALTTVQTTWNTVWTALPTIVNTARATIQTALQPITAWLTVNIPVALNGLRNLWNAIWPTLGTAVQTAWTAVLATFNTLRAWLTANLPGALTTLRGLWETGWTTMRTAVATAWTGILSTLTIWQTWLNTNLPNAMRSLQSVWEGSIGLITGSSTRLSTTFTSLGETVKTVSNALSAAWLSVELIFGPSVTRIIANFKPMTDGLLALGPQFSGLGVSIQSMSDVAMPPLKLVADIIGVTILLALNLLGETMKQLPTLVGTAVTQVTASINLIVSVVRDVTSLVTALINGDWAGAWTAAQAIVTDFGSFINTTLLGIKTAVGSLFLIISGTVTDILADLGFSGAAEKVQAVIDKVTALGAQIAGLVSGDISIGWTEPTWMADLRGTVTVPPAWIDTLGTVANTITTSPLWVEALRLVGEAIAEAPAWIAVIKKTVEDVLTSPAWIEVWRAAVEAVFQLPGWVTTAKAFVDKLFTVPTWVASVKAAIDNLFVVPTWITTLQGIVNSLTSWVPKMPDLNPFKATGDSYFSGGGVNINERGRELVSIPKNYAFLPPGSRIYTNGQSNRMMQGQANGQPVTVNLNGVVIADDQDIHRTAFQIGNQLHWNLGR